MAGHSVPKVNWGKLVRQWESNLKKHCKGKGTWQRRHCNATKPNQSLRAKVKKVVKDQEYQGNRTGEKGQN